MRMGRKTTYLQKAAKPLARGSELCLESRQTNSQPTFRHASQSSSHIAMGALRRHVMRARIILTLIIIGSAIAVLGVAQATDEFNFKVIDGNAWLIEIFSEARIYAIDPETNVRIDLEPAISLRYPEDPIQLQLDPGIYEFAIEIFHLREEVLYFRFEITEGELKLVDLREQELPEELAIY